MLYVMGMCVTIYEMTDGHGDKGKYYGTFSSPANEKHLEEISDAELSYIQDVHASIIAKREFYSWEEERDGASPSQAPKKSSEHLRSHTSPAETTNSGLKKSVCAKKYNKKLALAISPNINPIEPVPQVPLGNRPSLGAPNTFSSGSTDSSLLKSDKRETEGQKSIWGQVDLKDMAVEGDEDNYELAENIDEDRGTDNADLFEQENEVYLSDIDENELLDNYEIEADSEEYEEYLFDSEAIEAEEEEDEEPEIDWRGYEVDTEEYDETDAQYSDIEIETDGRLDRYDRALQVAITIGEKYDLDRNEITFLAELFEESGWSATKSSIIEALDNGGTIHELRLAYAVKIFWDETPEFTSGYNRKFDIMSWPTALVIIRSFGSYPDSTEIERLLFELYERWECDFVLQRTFQVFGYFIYYCFGRLDGSLDLWPDWTFEASTLLTHDMLSPPSSLDMPELSRFKSEFELHKIRLRYPEY